MTRTSVHRRRDGRRAASSHGLRTPTAGRHADLLRLASSVGNRRMAQIARQPVLFTVKARAGGAELVQFVAHYHPGAEKASVGRAASSQKNWERLPVAWGLKK